MKDLIDELYEIASRETLLRAELRELKSRRGEIEGGIIGEMLNEGVDERQGSKCRVELRDSKEFDSELAESTFPRELFPEVWGIKATALKAEISRAEYESFRRPTGGAYLKILGTRRW